MYARVKLIRRERAWVYDVGPVAHALLYNHWSYMGVTVWPMQRDGLAYLY